MAGALVSTRVRMLSDNAAELTLDSAAGLRDEGKVFCSLNNVTGNTTIDSPPTHVYVHSQCS